MGKSDDQCLLAAHNDCATHTYVGGSCGGRKEARFVSQVSSPRASLLHIVTFLGLSRF